jgi:hypothetical protein
MKVIFPRIENGMAAEIGAASTDHYQVTGIPIKRNGGTNNQSFPKVGPSKFSFYWFAESEPIYREDLWESIKICLNEVSPVDAGSPSRRCYTV